MTNQVHSQNFQVILKNGTRTNLEKTAASNAGVQAEAHYTTDTKQLFVHDGTINQPIQSLDMAVCIDNSVICLDNEIVYLF